eukprot:8159745-Pyramimonas_sp.AAC.1
MIAGNFPSHENILVAAEPRARGGASEAPLGPLYPFGTLLRPSWSPRAALLGPSWARAGGGGCEGGRGREGGEDEEEGEGA